MRNIYKLTTTFVGSSEPSSFYFSSEDIAQTFLREQCWNGKIEEYASNIDVPYNSIQMWSWDELKHRYPEISLKFQRFCGIIPYVERREVLRG